MARVCTPPATGVYYCATRSFARLCDQLRVVGGIGDPVTSEAVLQFWFADSAQDAAALDAQRKLWFSGGPELDRQIGERFGSLLARALDGELETWRESPRSALALVLVLDQFPRNVHRGTAKSFAGDAAALEVARSAVDRAFDRSVAPVEAAFFYMPFEHSEDLDDQHRSVELFRDLRRRAPAEIRHHMISFEEFAVRHCEIIQRFGRFPHRNEILDRTPTEAERLYLASGGHTFGTK